MDTSPIKNTVKIGLNRKSLNLIDGHSINSKTSPN